MNHLVKIQAPGIFERWPAAGPFLAGSRAIGLLRPHEHVAPPPQQSRRLPSQAGRPGTDGKGGTEQIQEQNAFINKNEEDIKKAMPVSSAAMLMTGNYKLKAKEKLAEFDLQHCRSPQKVMQCVEDRNIPLRPDDKAFLARAVTHGGNKSVETDKWGLTLRQFNKFIDMCQNDKQKWEQLRAENNGYVNCYQICQHFVKPFTRGTGCGVSLLLNPVRPLSADIMISHTWAEDILEVQEVIQHRVLREHHSQYSPGDDIVIWFCLFALYQPGSDKNDCGPTISKQLEQNPLDTVIFSSSLKKMCLAVTSRQDPYERLWCVYELSVALDSIHNYKHTHSNGDNSQDVNFQVASSKRFGRTEDFVAVEFSTMAWYKYRNAMLEWARKESKSVGLSLLEMEKKTDLGLEYAFYAKTIDARNAQTSNENDRQYIVNKIERSPGGWNELNRKIALFRRPRSNRGKPVGRQNL